MIVPVMSLSILSFIFALVVTPRVAALAERFDLLDKPSARKVHNIAIPRIGGIAIFLAFSLSLFTALFFENFKTQLLDNNEIIYLFAGGILSLLLGLYDDIKQLGPKVKFAVQTGIAIFAFLGGIKIRLIGLPLLGPVYFGWLELPVTILWMLLVINAINLIDGLDGLAAGVSFFICIVLLAVAISHELLLVAIALACLSGSLLGFLVFNFNPASIFMGDSGSYFIGYMLASLSIAGSIKSHTAVTFLIPIIAMGVPLLDTVWATTRRFIFGQELFQPDKDHFHHRLMRKGFSHKRT
ncbi:MAG: MraY family glycosyltransferase, partial [Desulfobulbaceae bacterium]|nr:MraY family glycosyltransferase [Desulfobulbaceae bacterium]